MVFQYVHMQSDTTHVYQTGLRSVPLPKMYPDTSNVHLMHRRKSELFCVENATLWKSWGVLIEKQSEI